MDTNRLWIGEPTKPTDRADEVRLKARRPPTYHEPDHDGCPRSRHRADVDSRGCHRQGEQGGAPQLPRTYAHHVILL